MTAKTTETVVEPDVHLTVPAATARIMVEALDTYTRIGMGQLEDIVSMGRFGILKNSEGVAPSYDAMEDAEHHLNAAKKSLFGFPSNASHGIFSDKVAERFRTTWGVMKALRHRLAWDRTPEGGFQTSFDEPMRGEESAGVHVTSGSIEDALVQLPAGTMLTRHNDAWAVVRMDPEKPGVFLQMLSTSHSWQTAIQKAKNALEPKPLA